MYFFLIEKILYEKKILHKCIIIYLITSLTFRSLICNEDNYLINEIKLENVIVTHTSNEINFDINQIQERLRSKKTLFLPLEEELRLLQELTEFELGRFILSNQGLNGYWRNYAIMSRADKDFHPLERWLLFEAPAVSAARERFPIFRKQLQKYLKSNINIASIPCGLSYDLLNLNYANLSNIKIFGIDPDQESINLAKEKSALKKITNIEFIHANPLNLNINNQFDIIVSNSFNIYEKKLKKLKKLYGKFYKALKYEGILITSFVTVPPTESDKSIWINFSMQDLQKELAVLYDIMDVKFGSFQTEEEYKKMFKEIGFKIIDIIYDSKKIFPTVIAKKHK